MGTGLAPANPNRRMVILIIIYRLMRVLSSPFKIYFKEDTMNYIGIDLHSDRFTCCYLHPDGSQQLHTFDLSESDLRQFFATLQKKDFVAVEVSTNTFSFTDLLEDKVQEVYIINPLQFSIIHNTSKKTDKIDATKIAKFLKYFVETKDEELFPLVYKPTKTIRQLRSLFTTYKNYKKEIVSTKNRIHSILKGNLKVYPRSQVFLKRNKAEILNLDLAESYKAEIQSLFRILDFIVDEQKQIVNKIIEIGDVYKQQIDLLMSIRGVSAFIAIAIISDFADITRFKNTRHFASYLRAAPKVDSSNQTTHIGHTNKKGRKLAVSLLTQSIIHFRRENSYIAKFYNRKIQGKSAGKVRMAVIRKMLTLIFYMLKEGKENPYKSEESFIRKKYEYELKLKKIRN